MDAEGKQLGILPTPEALKRARESGFDLVMVSPGAAPPVCRIADYGKLRYELTKKEKEARKAQKGGGMKEVKLSTKIAQHDCDVRVKKARGCLEARDKVKVSMFFRGREMAHVDLGMKVMGRMVEALADLGKP
ncbi:MAG: translation initiation factor IF-3, partial [Candidatus Margulisbacteria bacterium]|nr:translation initiation factor IF-3 [Candidatus Margulisiibacteriota bacterium]